MTTYNTGNPIGSTDPRDLYDNAENLDAAVNDTANDTWHDRLGRSRKTMSGMEREFNADQAERMAEFSADQSSREAVFSDFLQASGYQDLGEYAPGIEITAHNQYVTFGGQPYLLKPSIPVPYTTSGAWTGDDFKLIGDGSLRQDLANPDKGAAMVARAIVVANTVSEMLGLASVTVSSTVQTKGYHSPGDGGGAYYDISITPRDFAIPLASGLFANPVNLNSPRQVGWTESGGAENHDLLAEFAKNGYVTANSYSTINTREDFVREWLAGNNYPIAFYGDSTTDGYGTTGHESNFISGMVTTNYSNPIVIRESPNSYPSILESELKKVLGDGLPISCYNAGFDSESLYSFDPSGGFGTRCFHRVFFGYPEGLNNVDYSDVKGIVLSWGISDMANNNDIQSVLDSYEWKMEFLIAECFERGIQPYIADPIYGTQRDRGTPVSRDNTQALTLIQSMNKKLRNKFNLEQFSLRTPLEQYIQNGRGQFGDVIPDTVHANDLGARLIAGYYVSLMNPLTVTLGSDAHRFHPASDVVTLGPKFTGATAWETANVNTNTTRDTFRWRFVGASQYDKLYEFSVYCEQPQVLLYDYSSTEPQIYASTTGPNVHVTTSMEPSTIGLVLYLEQMMRPYSSGSDYRLLYLPVGLASVKAYAALNVVNESRMGNLKTLPLRDFGLRSLRPGLYALNTPDVLVTAGSDSPNWSSYAEDTSNYAFQGYGEVLEILFETARLEGVSITFNASTRFFPFDCYDKIMISEDTATFVTVVGDAGGNSTEIVLGTVPLLNVVDTGLEYRYQLFFSDLGVLLRRVDKLSGVETSLFDPVAVPSGMSRGGYGIGFKIESGSPLFGATGLTYMMSPL